MKQAVFITGFSNWGKSMTIQRLFNNRVRYYQGWTYRIDGINSEFTVESQSNDDWWGEDWIRKLDERISNQVNNDANLFTALCPTFHNDNNFVDLLSNPLFNKYDKLHVFLLEFKWEHHAKLMIDNVIKKGEKIPNINFIRINADELMTNKDERFDARINQIHQALTIIFS